MHLASELMRDSRALMFSPKSMSSLLTPSGLRHPPWYYDRCQYVNLEPSPQAVACAWN